MKSLLKVLISVLVLGISVNCFAQSLNEERKVSEEGSISSVSGANIADDKGKSTKEAGAYERKSVAFLNVVLTKGTNRLNPEFQSGFIKTFQNAVRMSRFDYNNIPQSVTDDFLNLPENMPIEERMNRAVVPAILAAVDAEKEMRAQNLLSEQQRNSFITDKAKELGITETELYSVMNSAYIFAPVYIGHKEERYEAKDIFSGKVTQMFRVTLSAGGYWWKIDNSGDKPSVKLIGRIERTSTGSEEISNKNHRIIAFNSAMNSVASYVGVATKALPDFKLTAQIIHRTPRNVVLSIGEPEGVTVDNKYYIIESREDVDGGITEKQRGWVMVSKVGEDAKGLDSMQSQAQIISGAPYIGAKLEEIPVQPIDITIGFAGVPFKENKKGDWANSLFPFDGLELGYMYGPKLKIGINMSNTFGLSTSQLWLNINGELLFGDAKGNDCWGNEFNSAMAYGGELSLTKKYYFRRFVLAPEVGFAVKNLDLSIAYNPLFDLSWSQLVLGGFVNLGIECAIHPMFNLGVLGGFNFQGGLDAWKLKLSSSDEGTDDISSGRYNTGYRTKATGLTFGVYGTYSIPSGSKQERYNDVARAGN